MAFSMLGATSAFAASSSYKLGDVNGDENVSVLDATLIQKYLVGSQTLTDEQKKAADVNFDGNISVVDSTLIQKYVVNLIDSFYSVSSNNWTALYTYSTKNFKLNTSTDYSYSIDYQNGSNWITVNKTSSSAFTIKVATNNTSTVRGATVNIKINDNGDILPIKIKQLGNLKTGYDACYTYSMKLASDPRGNVGSTAKAFDYKTNPGTPGRISQDSNYSKFTLDQFNVIATNENIFDAFESYAMKYVKADFKALGWGIKKASGANAKVSSGNWLVALTFNPSENYSDDTKLVYVSDKTRGGAPFLDAVSQDYHWYRRVDKSDGTSYWTHKRGTTAAVNMPVGKTPETYDATTNTIPASTDRTGYYTALKSYINGYNALYQKYLDGTYRADPEDYDVDIAYSYEVTNSIKNVADRYYLIGYYEVGPNV
jgi:hypothetical protein